jgi:hypothetical protein
MPNSFTKYLLIILLALGHSSFMHAQPKDNSPFSQFGIGDFFESNMVSSHAMGGMNAAYHDFFEANLENPASLGFLQYTSFQLGTFVKRSNYQRYDSHQKVWTGNMDHLSLNIPLINPLNEALERRETKFEWGTSFSMKPYAQVGYHINIQDTVDSIGLVTRDFKGAGGLYQITWGNGFKYGNLCAGVNLTYLYGKEAYDQTVQFNELENAYQDIFSSTIAYKGFQYRLGLQYEQPLDLKAARAKDDKPSRLLSAGIYYSGNTTFSTHSDISKLALNIVSHDLDTAYLTTGTLAHGMMPAILGFGMMYRDAAKFRVGFDFQSTQWSEYNNEVQPDTFKNTTRLGLGIAWIPDANSIISYFKRVEYRAGFYTKSDPRVIEGQQVKENAFTLGASFPLIAQRNIAWFQVGLDFGRRTGGPNLSENFIRGKIGLVFNDNAWFIRSKYH